MIELPEIDERIYELFGDTDLIEGCLDGSGYRWTKVAQHFVSLLRQQELDRCLAKFTPLRQDSVTAD